MEERARSGSNGALARMTKKTLRFLLLIPK
jgi:hypothetical protein